MRPRIYVAGPYTAGYSESPLAVLQNIARGVMTSLHVLRAGGAPFCPWWDALAVMFAEGLLSPVSCDEYADASMSWLPAAKGIVLCKGWRESRGSLLEVEEAKRIGLSIYEWDGDLDGLREWIGAM